MAHRIKHNSVQAFAFHATSVKKVSFLAGFASTKHSIQEQTQKIQKEGAKEIVARGPPPPPLPPKKMKNPRSWRCCL